MEPTYIYRAALERVIDGDTYRLLIDLGFRCSVSIEARLHGIDVYEHNTPQGAAASRFVSDLFTANPAAIVVRSYKDERSFARWVCDVEVGGLALADELRARGFEKATT